MSPQISSSKVEKVVNAPRNPTIIAKRRLSLTVNLSVKRTKKKPIKKEPTTLIKNVGKGNFSNIFCNGEIFIKYLAVAPNAPPTATDKIFVKDSI